MVSTEERSRREKSGDSISCQIMVGTPVVPLIFSASISSSARSGDQRCMKTILAPPAMAGTSIEWQPVTWNRGTGSSIERCGASGSGGGGISPVRRTIARAEEKPMLIRFDKMLRWDPCAPLGRPVVPEV